MATSNALNRGRVHLAAPCLFIMCCCILSLHAQTLDWAYAPEVRLDDATGGIGMSVTVDAAGNSYITGSFFDTTDFDPGPGVMGLISKGSDDIFILKLDPQGIPLWVRGMGGPGWGDIGHCITMSSQGNLVVTGRFKETVDFDPGSGVFDLTAPVGGSAFFILMIDSSGNFLSAYSMDNTHANGFITHVMDDNDNIYTAGYFYETVDLDPGIGSWSVIASGGQDIFLQKLDPSASLIWARTIGSALTEYPGGIAVDGAGAVFVTGSFVLTVDFDPGPGVYNLNAVLARDAFVLKLNADGVFEWAHSMGSSAQENGRDIVVDDAGNVYTLGYFSGPVDFDPGTGIMELEPNGNSDVFIQKVSGAGDFISTITIGDTLGGFGSITPESIDLDSLGNLLIAGAYWDQIDLDPGPGQALFPAVDGEDLFIVQLDATGAYVKGMATGASNIDRCERAVFDETGNVVGTGTFMDTVDFDPGPGIYELTASNLYYNNLFVLRFTDPSTGIEPSFEGEIAIYPNPASAMVFIEALGFNGPVTITLFDAIGKQVDRIEGHAPASIQLDVTGYAPGIYILEIRSELGSRSAKLIKY